MTRLSLSLPSSSPSLPCAHSKRPRVCVENVPSVPATCPHVLYTRGRFECAHGGLSACHSTTNTTPHQHPHQHAHNTSQTHNNTRHHTTPHTAPTHGTYTSNTTHHDTSRTPHTTPQPAYTYTRTRTFNTHTTQQVQTMNCPPSGN